MEFEKKIAGIDLTVHQVNITNFQIPESSLAFVDDTDTLRLTLGGIKIDTVLDVSATSLFPVPLEIESASITDISIQVDLATSADSDQVIWQLTESSEITIGDIDIKATKKFWQNIIDGAKGEILTALNYGIDVIEGVITGAVDALNTELAAETANTFVFPLKGMPFNATMARYPEFNQADNRVQLNIDGEFTGDGLEQVHPSATWADYEQNSAKQRQ